ncbi:hypothetical protein Droror1_Dr00015545 [Drosera rotundifolia]
MPGEAPIDGKSQKKWEEAAEADAVTKHADQKELTSDNPEIDSPRSEISGGKACINNGRGEGGGAMENLIGESETSEFNAKRMRKSKPGLKRLFLSASVFFSFFLAKKVAEMFVNVFENGGRKERSIHGEFMPVGADGSMVLSFNLLNANPNDWIYEWDFKRAEEILLAPLVEALAPIVNISVESQILYHTPKSFFSHWDDEKGSHIFSTQDLPFFVNSNEWHLDTSVAAGGRSEVLHIVIYVPSAKECPLLLQLPDGEVSKTNSFISPMWGGVIIWNPSDCSRTSDIEYSLRHTIPFPDLVEVFEVFMGQLRQLFGLGSESVYAGSPGSVNFLPSERGFTEWELDVLSRQHTCFNLQSCATTLGSLSRLVQSLPRMIIIDEIGKQVKFSLQEANLAQDNASLGIYDASAVSSRQARSLAEDAFLHPSIMSVSYYSFEHCFAVYSPFFLPVLLHVVIAAIKEGRRYKQEMSKYVAWKAKENVVA